MAAIVVPHGDTAGMRALASLLAHQAGTIADLAQRVAVRVHGVEFQGPAADATRARTDGQRRTAEHLAERLRSTSAFLSSQASRLERDIAEARRRAERGF